jgi:hypothetical protein
MGMQASLRFDAVNMLGRHMHASAHKYSYSNANKDTFSHCHAYNQSMRHIALQG